MSKKIYTDEQIGALLREYWLERDYAGTSQTMADMERHHSNEKIFLVRDGNPSEWQRLRRQAIAFAEEKEVRRATKH